MWRRPRATARRSVAWPRLIAHASGVAHGSSSAGSSARRGRAGARPCRADCCARPRRAASSGIPRPSPRCSRPRRAGSPRTRCDAPRGRPRRVAAAEVVERRRALPVGQVGIHAARQQQAQDLRILQQIRAAGGEDRRHARAGGEQPHDEIPLAERRRGGEHAAAAGVRRARIGRHPPDHLVILVRARSGRSSRACRRARTAALRSSGVFAAHVALPDALTCALGSAP